MTSYADTLACRLGKSVHISPLRMKLRALAEKYPVSGGECIEDWLIEVANARGARIVTRPNSQIGKFKPPIRETLSNEELITGICQLQCLDRPQILRLAAQLITNGSFEMKRLLRMAKLERIETVLADLAKQARKADPEHTGWKEILNTFKSARPLKHPILHWTRIAQPVMKDGRCNAEKWVLVT